MNTTPTRNNNVSTQKPVTSDLLKNGRPNVDVQTDINEAANKGDAHLRDAYAGAHAAQEGAADLLEKTFSGVARGAVAFNLKAFDLARINTRSAFDYAQALLEVRSPSEFIELSTNHMRKQFEVASAQSRELLAVANEAAAQIKSEMSAASIKAV